MGSRGGQDNDRPPGVEVEADAGAIVIRSTVSAWSNLAKLAPWGGGNPGGALLDVQRRLGPELLGIEVAELRPDYVLVLTGRWWSQPFVDGLGLDVDWRSGLLEGVAEDGARRWVIAPHPQGKPRALWDEVAAAL